MEEFPFTEAEWSRVTAATLDVTNATLADDEVLRASCFVTLQQVLGELRERHGDHPVLVETEADFSEDEVVRVNLYRAAIRSAAAHRLPTLSVRLAFARVLVKSGRSVEAMNELSASEVELKNGDEAERNEWLELSDAARQPKPIAGSDGG
jgi:hypothetical protein